MKTIYAAFWVGEGDLDAAQIPFDAGHLARQPALAAGQRVGAATDVERGMPAGKPVAEPRSVDGAHTLALSIAVSAILHGRDGGDDAGLSDVVTVRELLEELRPQHAQADKHGVDSGRSSVQMGLVAAGRAFRYAPECCREQYAARLMRAGSMTAAIRGGFREFRAADVVRGGAGDVGLQIVDVTPPVEAGRLRRMRPAFVPTGTKAVRSGRTARNCVAFITYKPYR